MFSRVFRLLTEDCDVNKNLRLSRLFQFLQEISIADTERLGYPREKTLDKGLLWVVGKQRVEIKRLPVYGEEIRLETWPGEKTPFLFPRHYAIYGNNEEPLVKASAVWTLISEQNRMMVNPKDHGIVIEGEARGGEIPFQFPMKSFPLLGRAMLKASWRDCDLNGHMNNTAYLDEAEDLIPLEYLKSHVPAAIDIAYRKEIPLGEEVEVSYGNEGGVYVFSCPSFFLRLTF